MATSGASAPAQQSARHEWATRLPGSSFVAILAVAILTACGPAPAPATSAAAAQAWHELGGTWNGTGHRRTLVLGDGRYASLIDLTGTMLLAGDSNPGIGFRVDAIVLSDSATGIDGRCVWTDENGDRVFSEVHGAPFRPGGRITGTFVGGTGRYVGAEGTYEFTWRYMLESEDGSIQGRAVDLKGRVRFVGAAPARGNKP